MSWLYQREWSQWELIIVAVVAVFVFLWIIRRQRKRAYRNIYDNKFLENTPVIGAKLGSRKRRRHIIKDFKKAQLAAAHQGHANQQSTNQTEPDKLREQIRELQREIIKHKESKVRLEQQVAEITAAKNEIQRELDVLKQTEQPAMPKDEAESISEEQSQPEIQEDEQAIQPVSQEPATDEKEQPVISESEQPQQDTEEQVVEVSAEDEQVKRKLPRRSKTHENIHRIVEDVKQKLCRKCNEWKPESEFHKNASSKDGLAGSCKTCKAEAAKEYRRRRKTAQD